MNSSKPRKDKHYSSFTLDNLFRRLFISPHKFCKYVKQGDKVADLGSGPGYFTLPLAEKVGDEGLVYAVDSDGNAIQDLIEKTESRKFRNIKAFATFAADISFIETGSINFVLAWELLCCVVPMNHEKVINEIKRIMRQDAKAMLSVDRYFGSYVKKNEWEVILEGFYIHKRNGLSLSKDRWALVSKKT